MNILLLCWYMVRVCSCADRCPAQMHWQPTRRTYSRN